MIKFSIRLSPEAQSIMRWWTPPLAAVTAGAACNYYSIGYVSGLLLVGPYSRGVAYALGIGQFIDRSGHRKNFGFSTFLTGCFAKILTVELSEYTLGYVLGNSLQSNFTKAFIAHGFGYGALVNISMTHHCERKDIQEKHHMNIEIQNATPGLIHLSFILMYAALVNAALISAEQTRVPVVILEEILFDFIKLSGCFLMAMSTSAFLINLFGRSDMNNYDSLHSEPDTLLERLHQHSAKLNLPNSGSSQSSSQLFTPRKELAPKVKNSNPKTVNFNIPKNNDSFEDTVSHQKTR
jgi:hypothetical protein